jgi:transglutaminase-like putative cysteine protease
VSSTVTDVLEAKKGVCQDFAHLAVACLRSVGLAGRYVSGYLATRPPPGKPRMIGADASHAWAAVRLADSSWLNFDPTNDTFIDERFTTVAWGRDYDDVAPLRGVIYTDAKKREMDVSVDVAPL